ncbi:MAG: glycosyltransferase family 4 protein [Saprospiraceae bacterium]|nr:glycosyltransferase family 4 protein [Saprospiraceae bacterium]
MRVGFDAKRLFFNDTGLGVYSRLLVRQLATKYPSHQYILFSANAQKSAYYRHFSDLDIVGNSLPVYRSWRMSSDIHRTNCDVFHGLSHELPLGLKKTRVKSIVTIHDLIFEHYPDLYPFIDRTIYRWKWKHSCHFADIVIAVSEQTKRDLIELYRIDETRIRVIPPMFSDQFDRAVSVSDKIKASQEHNLPEEFFLFVGSITRRKNLIIIIEAMSKLQAGERLPLLVIGSHGDDYKNVLSQISKYGLRDWVHFLSAIENEQLHIFYKLARALIYPSLFEGFGIPIVESLRCGTPVITSSISSMPEAAGPGALYIDPNDSDALAQHMLAIRQHSTYEVLSTAGQKHVEQFSPDNVGKQVLDLYQELLSR